MCTGERAADRARKRTAGKEHGHEGSRNDDVAVMEPTVGGPRAVCWKANKCGSVLGPRNIFSVVSQQQRKDTHTRGALLVGTLCAYRGAYSPSSERLFLPLSHQDDIRQMVLKIHGAHTQHLSRNEAA